MKQKEMAPGALSLVRDCTLKLLNSVLIGSKSLIDGGAVHLGASNAIVKNTTFLSSVANADGAAFNAHNSSVHVNSSIFMNNSTGEKSGAIFATTGTIESSFSCSTGLLIVPEVLSTAQLSAIVVLSRVCLNKIVQTAEEELQCVQETWPMYLSTRAINTAKRGGALAARESGALLTQDINSGEDSSLSSAFISNNTASEGGAFI